MRTFFSSIMRRRSIRLYVKRLGPLLRKRYGRSRNYTAGQIRQTVTNAGMPVAHICFAYAMFMPHEEFDALHRELGETCDYQAMRQEVADLHFSGDSTFSVEVVLQADSFGGGDGGFGGDSAGGDGGGGGGNGGGGGGGNGGAAG
jgi:uncharacterized membrane protein YgcG